MILANRFTTKGKREHFLLREVVLPVLLFVMILLFLLRGLSSLGTATQREQLNSVHRAVMNATVQCYALEGRYPPNVDYLREHYGLQVDDTRYIIHYSVFASNLMPDIDVIPRFAMDGTWLGEVEE